MINSFNSYVMTQTITMAEILTNPVYSLLVDDLYLSPRVMNCCKNDDRCYVGEIIQKTEQDFVRSNNFGLASLLELNDALGKFGVALDTTIQDAPPPDKLRTELKRMRDRREKGLTKLQRLAAPERPYQPDQEWLEAARELLTPAIINRMADHRYRAIISGRIQNSRITLEELGKPLNLSKGRVHVIERDAVKALKRTIRSVLPSGSS